MRVASRESVGLEFQLNFEVPYVTLCSKRFSCMGRGRQGEMRHFDTLTGRFRQHVWSASHFQKLTPTTTETNSCFLLQ